MADAYLRDGREYAVPVTVSTRRRLGHNLLIFVLVAVALVAIVLVNLIWGCTATTGRGGAACWWDSAPRMARDSVRVIWSSITGQDYGRDLFPN